MSTLAEAPPRVAAEQAERAHEAELGGRWEEAAGLYAQVFRAASLAGGVEEAADALRGQARVLIREDRHDEAEELLTLSLEIAERSRLTQSAARAINVLGIIRSERRDWAGARELFRRALELAMDIGDDELVGLACQNAGVVAYTQGDLREARSRYLESIGSFVRSGDTENALHAYNNLGIASAELREWLEADAYFSRGIEIAERMSRSPLLARLYCNRAEPLIRIGDLEPARASLDRAEQMAEAVGDRLGLAIARRWRAALAREEGDLAAAGEHLDAALALAQGASLERGEMLRDVAELHRAAGRLDEARAAYAEAVEVLDQVGAEGLLAATRQRMSDLG